MRTANSSVAISFPPNFREEIVRIDHRFSDKFSDLRTLGGRGRSARSYGTSQWTGDNVPTIGDVFGNPSYHGVIHATYSISPTLLNEIAFNYNGNRIRSQPVGHLQAAQRLNIPELFPGNNLNRIPQINLAAQPAHNMT